MARVDCGCPLAVSGYRRQHIAGCPNGGHRTTKGQQPKDYTGKARKPRTYSHARQAVERLRMLLGSMADSGYMKQYEIADCRMQAEEIRRYLDGE